MLRNAFVLSTFALAASAAIAQTPCDPEDFDNTCDGATITFCSTQDADGNAIDPVTATQDCTLPDANGAPQVPNGTCGSFDCTGNNCDELDDTCLSGAGDFCLAFSPLLDADAANDDFAFAALCVAGQSCVLGAEGDVCVPQIAQPCDGQTLIGCDGNTVFLCLGNSEDTNGNGTLDDGEDADGDGELGSFDLVDPAGVDCAAFGGTCNEAAVAGPLHDALGAGANPIPDCELPAEGEGEGEGEGEDGGDECQEDADCNRGEVCTDGACEAEEDEEDEDDEGAVACTNLGGGMAPLGLALVALFRRRRA